MFGFSHLPRFTLAVVFAVVAALAPPEQAIAQTPPTPEQRIADWDRTAEAVEAALAIGTVNADALDRLRRTMETQRLEARALIEELEQELAPLQAQLEALGPAPVEGGIEAPEIAGRRIALMDRIARLESLRSEARLVATRAVDLEDRLARLSREERSRLILRKGPSIFDAVVWTNGPRELAEIGGAAGEAIAGAIAQLDPFGAHASGTLGLVLLTFGLVLTTRLRTRAYQAIASAALSVRGPLPSASIALALASLRLFAPIIVTIALFWFASSITGLSDAARRMLVGVGYGVIWASVAYAMAKLVYAPAAPRLRVIDLGDEGGLRATRLLAVFAVLAVIYNVVIAELLIADGEWAATTIVGTVFGAIAGPLIIVIAQTLCRISQTEALPTSSAENEEPQETEEFDLGASVLAVLRLALTLVGLALPIAAALGFVSLARFLAINTGLTLFVAAVAGITYAALIRVIAASDAPDNAPFGVERSRWRFAPLLIGILIACCVAPAVAFIWGASETDLRSLGVGLVEGFEIGDDRFSPFDIILALFTLVFGLWVTRLLQGFLRGAVLPKTKLDSGVRGSLIAGVGYIGIFITALIAISTAGLDLSNLALVVGALSVGIGFGLQNIVNNFVSGLILLIERPIRVGDWIVVGEAEGHVRRINVRSTEIETFDRAAVIVPNSDLIASQVTNLTHRNLNGRVFVQVGVGYNSDPDQVIKILREACLAQPRLLRYPEPLITFARFGDSALEFEARAYIRDVNYVLGARSDLNLEILKRLRAAGIEIPYPQHDVHFRDIGRPSEPSPFADQIE